MHETEIIRRTIEFPAYLYQRLSQAATNDRRSIGQEVLWLLEQALAQATKRQHVSHAQK
jgi:hypothetical protein